MPPAEETVYVVDDDPALGDSLCALLEAMGFRTKLFTSGADFLGAMPAGENACVLLDIRMPGIDGMSVLDRLQELDPDLPVVIMTGHADVPLAVRAMKAGAVDVVEKPFREGDAVATVRAALAAGRDRGTSGEAPGEPPIAGLTPREREVFERIAAGQANKVIAADLGISQRTVEVHRASLMRKTGARNVADLVRLAVRLEREDAPAPPETRR